MNTISYSVLQYRHDRALDEAINIGVLAFSVSECRAAFEYDQHYKQLSSLYRNFDSIGFRSSLRRLGSHINRLNLRSQGRLIPAFEDRVQTAEQLLKSVWPDQGSSLVGCQSKYTVGQDVADEAKHLFDRFVSGHRPGQAYRGNRKDEDVWSSVMERLGHIEGLAARFSHQKIDQEIDFDYVAEAKGSSKLIAVEPVAFDYLNGSNVRERTFELVGKAIGLDSIEKFGQMFVVVGDVQRNADVRQTVSWAESYLKKNSRKTTVISESEIESLVCAFL